MCELVLRFRGAAGADRFDLHHEAVGPLEERLREWFPVGSAYSAYPTGPAALNLWGAEASPLYLRLEEAASVIVVYCPEFRATRAAPAAPPPPIG